jgi:hypothetical protein
MASAIVVRFESWRLRASRASIMSPTRQVFEGRHANKALEPFGKRCARHTQFARQIANLPALRDIAVH